LLCFQPNLVQDISWEKEFQAQELQLTSEASLSQQVTEEQIKPRSLHDADELSLTAGLLLDNLKHEENPKFQNSQFMGLMKQFRDREVVVDGNKIVETDGRTRIVDVKGKARAMDQVPRSFPGVAPVFSSTMQQEGNTVHLGQQSSNQELRTEEQEDPNVAYFQRENEDFIKYWNATPVPPAIESKEARFWDKLQEDWDEFEAAAGIKPVEVYQFQPNNPYLLGDSSRTRHHHLHQGHSFASEVGTRLSVF
jgi:peroxin-5